MKSMLPVFFLLALLRFDVSAQATTASCTNKVVVKQATQQRWSGGVVGRAGVNYSFTVETLPSATLDTVWIGDRPFGVRVQSDPRDYIHPANAVLTKTKKRWTYDVKVGIDRSRNGAEPREEPQKEVRVSGAPKYSGVAYITYTYKSKHDGVAVAKFTQLDPLNYP